MKTKELGSEEAVVVLPQPVNRQILVKYPISQSSVEGIIKLSPKAKQDEVQSKLVKLFPDGTMKYQIVARAEDCNPIYEVGILPCHELPPKWFRFRGQAFRKSAEEYSDAPGS